MWCSRPILSCLAAGLVLALSGGVRADFRIDPPQVKAVPLTQTNWTSGPTAGSTYDAFVFQKFDPTTYAKDGLTAVLTKIELTLTYEFDNTLRMRFDNVSTISVTAEGTMDLTLPDKTTSLLPSQPSFTHTQTLSSTPSDVFSKFVNLPMTPPVTGSVSKSFDLDTSAGYSVLSQFSGVGTIDLPAFAQASSTFTSSSGNGFGSSVTFASASVSLVYYYTLVPEPSAFVLMGLGVVGLGVAVGRSRFRLKTRDQA